MKKLLFPYGTLLALAGVLLFGVFTSVTQGQAVEAASNRLLPVIVTAYSDQGTMADGHQTRLGACAALVTQFPFGTKIQLFSPNNLNQPVFSCTVEDTGTHVCQNHIDVAMPGLAQRAIQFGRQQMLLKRVGQDQQVAKDAAANHPTSSGCQG